MFAVLKVMKNKGGVRVPAVWRFFYAYLDFVFPVLLCLVV